MISSRKYDFRLVISERLKESIGITVPDTTNTSRVVCNSCGRKLKNLSDTYKNVFQSLNVESQLSEPVKRNIYAIVSPERSSPNRKCKRIHSPAAKQLSQPSPLSRKSLFPTNKNLEAVKATENEISRKKGITSGVVLSKLNVDDLDTSKGSQIKVVVAYPSGNIIVDAKIVIARLLKINQIPYSPLKLLKLQIQIVRHFVTSERRPPEVIRRL